MDVLSPYYLGIIVQALVAVLLGLSIYFTLSAGLLSVGHAGFMSIGAFTAALVSLHLEWPMVAGLLAAMLTGAGAGLLIGLPTLRLRGVYLAVATLGFGEVVRVIFLNLEITGGALGLKNIPNFARLFRDWFGRIGMDGMLGLTATQLGQLLTLLLVGTVVALTIVFIRRQERSRFGRAIRAMGADEVAAEVAGISVVAYRMLTFVEGAAVAGLAGGLFAYVNNIVHPEMFGFQRAVDILLYAVLGGSGIVWGPVFGALTLSLLPEVLRFLQDYRNILFGAVLVFMMAVRPQGIIDRPLLDALARIPARLRGMPAAQDRAKTTSGGGGPA